MPGGGAGGPRGVGGALLGGEKGGVHGPAIGGGDGGGGGATFGPYAVVRGGVSSQSGRLLRVGNPCTWGRRRPPR